MEEKRAYVYIHKKITDGKVFYVGKGNNRLNRKTKQERAFSKNRRSDYLEQCSQ